MAKPIRIFLTGATGVMGTCGLKSLMAARREGKPYEVTVLARPGKKNERKLAPYIKQGVKVIWGDLLNVVDVAKGVAANDIVLHVGGMVSPMADWKPELTYKVNTHAMRFIVNAAEAKQGRGEEIKVVYIGSVSQYGNRARPHHWGRTGDPINVATYDKYALSKCDAEKMLAESKLRHWVSLRQTGIMHPAILFKADDPIAFHVPMATVLEWVTDEDSGRLLANVCSPELPEFFWQRFYNIGGGEAFRYDNRDFMAMTLKAVGCPPPEKAFRLNWFATRNFHGMWYDDSDTLNDLLHFRSGQTLQDYLDALTSKLPFYFKLAPLAPAWIIRTVMKRVAETPVLGPLDWIKTDNKDRIFAAWGGIGKYRAIPDWKHAGLTPPSKESIRLDHGYDESKPLESLTLDDMRKAAEFRGGKCLSESMEEGHIDTPLRWKCAEGHIFDMKPRTILLGGHWCGECLHEISDDPYALHRQAKKNPFLRQVES